MITCLLAALIAILGIFLNNAMNEISGLRQDAKTDHDTVMRITSRFDRLVVRLELRAADDIEQLCHAAEGSYDAAKAICTFTDGHAPLAYQPLEK